jgi:hypothetical protein
MRLPSISIQKHEGDDNYSWAVFRSDQKEPIICGLSKISAQFYKEKAMEDLKKEIPLFIERKNRNGTFTIIERFKTFEEALEELLKIKSSLPHKIKHINFPKWSHTITIAF